MIERCIEIGQSRHDDALCRAGTEHIPPLSFADKMCSADAPMVEAAVNGQGKVVVDPALLEEIRDGVVDVCEHAAAGKVQDADVFCVGVVVAEKNSEREPAEEVGNRVPLALERAEEFRDPVSAQPTGVTRHLGVLKLRVLIDPVEAKGLCSILLVYERYRLAVYNTVVALDDEILACTVSHEFSAVMSEPELGSEGVPVVLPGEPVGTSGQPRLENMRRMCPAPGQVPLVTEPASSSFGWYPASIERLWSSEPRSPSDAAR